MTLILMRYICSLLIFFVCIPAAFAQKTAQYLVSIPSLTVYSGESVVSFEIDVTAGSFQSALDLPAGWFVIVDNDASWQTKIKANASVGAAALSPEDLKKLQFVVRKNEFGDMKFKLTATVVVTKDFQKERPVYLRMTDLAVLPQKRSDK